MGKYYKTHTVPLVDYVVDFPFDSLLKANMYKQERADKVQDLISEGKSKLLGMKVIKGKQNDQGVYQKSGDEIYRDQKISEYNNLIEDMKGKDLSQNYGLIRQKIDEIWDPHMVDIVASRSAYDEEQKQIAKWRSEGKWADSEYQDPRGWSTAEMGEYSAMNRPYIEWRTSAEKIFDGMQKDKGIDPSTGLQLAGISPQKIREQAQRSASGFYNSPIGQRAADDWISANSETVESWRAQGLPEEQVRLKATEEALFNTGMERHNREITPWAKGKGPGGSGTPSIEGTYKSPYILMMEGMLGNEQKQTTLNMTKQSPQVQALLNSELQVDESGAWMPINAGESGLILGDRYNAKVTPYFGVGESGVMGSLRVGDFDKNLGRRVTASDVYTQQHMLDLLTRYSNERETLDGWNEYNEIKKGIEKNKAEGRKRLSAYKKDPNFSYRGDELTELDISNQEAVIQAKQSQGSALYGPVYTQGVKRRGVGNEKTAVRYPNATITLTEDVLFDEGKPSERVMPKGSVMTMNSNDAQILLEKQGKWNYKKGEDAFYAKRLKENEEKYGKIKDRHALILQKFRNEGMPNPNGVYAQDLLEANRVAQENSAEDNPVEVAKLASAIKGDKIFQDQLIKFAPDNHNNYFVANGKTYISGSALLSEADLDALDYKFVEDEDGGAIIEDAAGTVYDINWSHWGDRLTRGEWGTPTMSQALKELGIAKQSNRVDGDGNPMYEIPLNIESKVGQFPMDNFNRAAGLNSKEISEIQPIETQRLTSLTLKAQADQMKKDATSWNNNYKNLLNTKYRNAIEDMFDYPAGGEALQGLAAAGTQENDDAFGQVIASEEVLGNLVNDYRATLDEALNDVDNEGNPDPWLGAKDAKEKLTPYLDAIEAYKDGDRSPGARKKAREAAEALSEQYGFLIDPVSYAPEGLGAKEVKGGTEDIRKQNFEKYVVKEFIDPKLSEAVKTNNMSAYKTLGAEKASVEGNVEYKGDSNISIKSTALIPYVRPEMNQVLNTINAQLKEKNIKGLAISGLYRTPEYNAKLRDEDGSKISAENSFHLEGMAADFSLATEANREAVAKLKSLIAQGAIQAPAGYRIDQVTHGTGGNEHFHIELEPLKKA